MAGDSSKLQEERQGACCPEKGSYREPWLPAASNEAVPDQSVLWGWSWLWAGRVKHPFSRCWERCIWGSAQGAVPREAVSAKDAQKLARNPATEGNVHVQSWWCAAERVPSTHLSNYPSTPSQGRAHLYRPEAGAGGWLAPSWQEVCTGEHPHHQIEEMCSRRCKSLSLVGSERETPRMLKPETYNGRRKAPSLMDNYRTGSVCRW